MEYGWFYSILKKLLSEKSLGKCDYIPVRDPCYKLMREILSDSNLRMVFFHHKKKKNRYRLLIHIVKQVWIGTLTKPVLDKGRQEGSQVHLKEKKPAVLSCDLLLF